MFSKSKVDEAAAAPKVPEPPPASIIRSDLKVTGDFECAGEVQVEGTVEGSVKGKKVVVTPTAMVKGTISADNAIISGGVNGEIKAQNVTLTKTARVTGNVIHDVLSIEPGATVDGHYKRAEKKVEPVAAPPAPLSASNLDGLRAPTAGDPTFGSEIIGPQLKRFAR